MTVWWIIFWTSVSYTKLYDNKIVINLDFYSQKTATLQVHLYILYKFLTPLTEEKKAEPPSQKHIYVHIEISVVQQIKKQN